MHDADSQKTTQGTRILVEINSDNQNMANIIKILTFGNTQKSKKANMQIDQDVRMIEPRMDI